MNLEEKKEKYRISLNVNITVSALSKPLGVSDYCCLTHSAHASPSVFMLQSLMNFTLLQKCKHVVIAQKGNS